MPSSTKSCTAMSIKGGRWKYLLDAGGRARLYDLRSDPAETIDLAAEHPEKLHSLVEQYQRWAEANNVMPPGEVDAWRKARREAKLQKLREEEREQASSSFGGPNDPRASLESGL